MSNRPPLPEQAAEVASLGAGAPRTRSCRVSMKGASLPLGRLVAGTAASRGAEAAPPRSPQPHHRPCRMSCGKDVVLPAAGGEGRAGETVQARGKQKLHQKKTAGERNAGARRWRRWARRTQGYVAAKTESVSSLGCSRA